MKVRLFLGAMVMAFAAIAGTASVNDTGVVYGLIVFVLLVLIGGGYVIKIVKQKLKEKSQQMDESTIFEEPDNK